MSIGNLVNGSGTGANGLIDDLRIYNTALSAAQVQSIYAAQGMPSRGVQIRAAQPFLLGNATILYGGAPSGNTAFYCTGPYATSSNCMNLGTSTLANFNYNSSNMFCEFWWYTSNASLTNLNTPISLGVFTTTSTSYRIQVRLNSGFALQFSTSVANTTPLTTRTWYHFAFSVDSTNKVLYPFVNGYGGVSTSYTGTLSYNASHSLVIGYSNALASNYYYDQYIRDLRVIQGGVVPTTNFTPESATWAYGAVPSYVSGGTNVLGLAAQYMTPTPMSGTPLFSQLSASAVASSVGAFSLRAINGTTAKAVQVKRQSDNVTQDFWADRLGNLLTAPITGTPISTWLAGSTGNVVTWYDQSGAGQHMTQTTASLQPTINLTTSPASIVFTGNGQTSGQYFQNTIPFTFNFGTNYQYSIRAVVNNTVGGCLMSKGTSGITWTTNGQKKWWLGTLNGGETTTGGYPNLVGFGEGYVRGQSAITSSKSSFTWASSAFSSVTLYENASSVTVNYNRASAKTDAGSYLYIGAGGQASYYNGNVYEIEIFSSTLGAADVTIMG